MAPGNPVQSPMPLGSWEASQELADPQTVNPTVRPDDSNLADRVPMDRVSAVDSADLLPEVGRPQINILAPSERADKSISESTGQYPRENGVSTNEVPLRTKVAAPILEPLSSKFSPPEPPPLPNMLTTEYVPGRRCETTSSQNEYSQNAEMPPSAKKDPSDGPAAPSETLTGRTASSPPTNEWLAKVPPPPPPPPPPGEKKDEEKEERECREAPDYGAILGPKLSSYKNLSAIVNCLEEPPLLEQSYWGLWSASPQKGVAALQSALAPHGVDSNVYNIEVVEPFEEKSFEPYVKSIEKAAGLFWKNSRKKEKQRREEPQYSSPSVPVGGIKNVIDYDVYYGDLGAFGVPKVYCDAHFSITKHPIFWQPIKTSIKLQDVLCVFLDRIEFELFTQISNKFESYVFALSRVGEIERKLAATVNMVKTLRGELAEVRQHKLLNIMKTLVLANRRERKLELLAKLKLLANVRRSQPSLQHLLASRQFHASLDLIEASHKLLKQNLQGIHCVTNLAAQLTELAFSIDKMLEDDIVHASVESIFASPPPPPQNLQTHNNLYYHLLHSNQCLLLRKLEDPSFEPENVIFSLGTSEPSGRCFTLGDWPWGWLLGTEEDGEDWLEKAADQVARGSSFNGLLGPLERRGLIPRFLQTVKVTATRHCRKVFRHAAVKDCVRYNGVLKEVGLDTSVFSLFRRATWAAQQETAQKNPKEVAQKSAPKTAEESGPQVGLSGGQQGGDKPEEGGIFFQHKQGDEKQLDGGDKNDFHQGDINGGKNSNKKGDKNRNKKGENIKRIEQNNGEEGKDDEEQNGSMSSEKVEDTEEGGSVRENGREVMSNVNMISPHRRGSDSIDTSDDEMLSEISPPKNGGEKKKSPPYIDVPSNKVDGLQGKGENDLKSTHPKSGLAEPLDAKLALSEVVSQVDQTCFTMVWLNMLGLSLTIGRQVKAWSSFTFATLLNEAQAYYTDKLRYHHWRMAAGDFARVTEIIVSSLFSKLCSLLQNRADRHASLPPFQFAGLYWSSVQAAQGVYNLQELLRTRFEGLLETHTTADKSLAQNPRPQNPPQDEPPRNARPKNESCQNSRSQNESPRDARPQDTRTESPRLRSREDIGGDRTSGEERICESGGAININLLGPVCGGLRLTLSSQAKSVVEEFHQSKVAQITLIIEKERWEKSDVPFGFLDDTLGIWLRWLPPGGPQICTQNMQNIPKKIGTEDSSNIPTPTMSTEHIPSENMPIQNIPSENIPNQNIPKEIMRIPDGAESLKSVEGCFNERMRCEETSPDLGEFTKNSLDGERSDTKKLNLETLNKYHTVYRPAEREATSFHVVPACLALLQIISEYMTVCHQLPFMAVDLLQRVAILLRTFNCAALKLVVQGAAVQKKSLKKVSANNLALDSQTAACLAELMPYILEAFGRALKTAAHLAHTPAPHTHSEKAPLAQAVKNAMGIIPGIEPHLFMTGQFAAIAQQFRDHRKQVYSKLSEILLERYESHSLKWLSTPHAHGPKEPSQVPPPHEALKALVKDITLLYKVLSKSLPCAEVESIFALTFEEVSVRFGRRMGEMRILSGNEAKGPMQAHLCSDRIRVPKYEGLYSGEGLYKDEGFISLGGRLCLDCMYIHDALKSLPPKSLANTLVQNLTHVILREYRVETHIKSFLETHNT